jgi:hypothetical protein
LKNRALSRLCRTKEVLLIFTRNLIVEEEGYAHANSGILAARGEARIGRLIGFCFRDRWKKADQFVFLVY